MGAEGRHATRTEPPHPSPAAGARLLPTPPARTGVSVPERHPCLERTPWDRSPGRLQPLGNNAPQTGSPWGCRRAVWAVGPGAQGDMGPVSCVQYPWNLPIQHAHGPLPVLPPTPSAHSPRALRVNDTGAAYTPGPALRDALLSHQRFSVPLSPSPAGPPVLRREDPSS